MLGIWRTLLRVQPGVNLGFSHVQALQRTQGAEVRKDLRNTLECTRARWCTYRRADSSGNTAKATGWLDLAISLK